MPYVNRTPSCTPAAWSSSFAASWRFFSFAFLFLISLLCTSCSASRGPNIFVPDPTRDYSLGMLHCVVPDDSLIDISNYYQRDIDLLANLNRLKPPYEIYQGELLFIPPDNSYAVLGKGRVTREYIDKIRSQRADLEEGATPALPPTAAVGTVKKPTLMKTIFSRGTSATPEKPLTTASSKATEGQGRTIPFTNTLPTGKRGVYVWPVGGRFERGFNPDPDKPHKGMDIAAPEGVVIRASKAGRVLYAGRFGSYGLVVVLDHGDGFATLYGHTSKTLVTKGQIVTQLQPIAEVGSTGRSTGPHLHFEVRYNGVAVDPEKYLPKIP